VNWFQQPDNNYFIVLYVKESQQPSYSPLGALFNMRPPHQTQQPPETTEQEEVLILSSTESPNIIVKQDRQTDMKMPTWPSHMAERQPAAGQL